MHQIGDIGGLNPELKLLKKKNSIQMNPEYELNMQKCHVKCFTIYKPL